MSFSMADAIRKDIRSIIHNVHGQIHGRMSLRFRVTLYGVVNLLSEEIDYGEYSDYVRYCRQVVEETALDIETWGAEEDTESFDIQVYAAAIRGLLKYFPETGELASYNN